MMRIATFFLVLSFVPMLCGAREIILSGSATIGPALRPGVNLDVTLLDPPGLPGSQVKTDNAGRFEMHLNLPDDRSVASSYVVLRLAGRGLQAMNIIYQSCDLTIANRCDEAPINLPLLKPAETDPAVDLSKVPQIPPGEYGLLLSSYEMLPPGSLIRIDNRLFAAAMRRSINTHLNELGATPTTLRFSPLPPVDILTIDESLSATSFHQRRAIGEYSGVMAVISGLGEIKSVDGQDRISMSTEFLLIPSQPGGRPQMVEIRDPDLPAAHFTSLALADSLSPLWQRFSLIALAKRELVQAKQAGDREALERIYAYVVAERGRLSADEQSRAAELERLRMRIDEALRQ